jgi:hypothetical protein
MIYKKPKDINYVATIIQIKNIIPIEGMDRIQHTDIFGNKVIVSKNVKIGDRGIFFPVECKLSEEYLKENNLYRDLSLNKDGTKKGYFEASGRIKALKFRGAVSSGLFMPEESLGYVNNVIERLSTGDFFDEIEGHLICEKYIVKIPSIPRKQNKYKKPKISKLIQNQFRFHIDTENLGKNIYKINLLDTISITDKKHGTSVISSKILCKRKLSFPEKIMKFLRVKINDVHYDNIYSSRRVIKNGDLEEKHFYNHNIWGTANEVLKDKLLDGMSIYAEIVGYLPSGKMIQKDYDYGCIKPEEKEPFKIGKHYKIYIYRITYTNTCGNVFEFSNPQIQEWIHFNFKVAGIEGVLFPEEIYKGLYKDFLTFVLKIESVGSMVPESNEVILDKIRKVLIEKNCQYCTNKVPMEGIVMRKESNSFDVYKYKSFFFLERETKMLDKNEEDIEAQNEVENEM